MYIIVNFFILEILRYPEACLSIVENSVLLSAVVGHSLCIVSGYDIGHFYLEYVMIRMVIFINRKTSVILYNFI